MIGIHFQRAMFALEVAPPLDLADDLETASVASESASVVEAASESPPLSLPSQPAAQTVAESAVHQHPPWIQAHQISVT